MAAQIYPSGAAFPNLTIYQPEHCPGTARPGEIEAGTAWAFVEKFGGDTIHIRTREVYSRHGKRQVDREVGVSVTRAEAITYFRQVLAFLEQPD